MASPIRVGLIGAGVVGSGVIKILKENQEIIEGHSSRPIVLASVCDKQVERVESLVSPSTYVTSNAEEVVLDPNLHVIIETMGGIEPARTLVLKAIETGKHVITANKALLATHGRTIFKAAEDRGVHVFFEASVGGIVPVIRTLRQSIVANRIRYVAGVINGTTNFILTQMLKDNVQLVDALREAQRLGYAESDPTLDINGTDAAHKLVILASIAYGVSVDFSQVYREGIESLLLKDMRYAQDMGYVVKLLGITKLTEKGLQIRVHPTLVPKDSPLATVDGVMNAVLINTDSAGSVVLYGRGAGSYPTASAILGDLIEVARLQSTHAEYRVPHLGYQPEAVKLMPFVSMNDVNCSYYLRLTVKDQPAVLAGITTTLAKYGVSISSMTQPENIENPQAIVDVVMLTHETSEQVMLQALTELQQLPFIAAPVVFLRKENLT
jgi:homoserine dehydrogenase